MQLFHIRDLIGQDPYTFLDDYPRRFQIQFDDGEILDTSSKKTFVSAFYWTLIRKFPEIVITSNHHFSKVMGAYSLQSGTHRKVASNIYKSIVDKHEFVTPEQREIVQRDIQIATNNLYLALRSKSGAYVQPIDILDCLALLYHPRNWKACAEAPDDSNGVVDAYAVVRDIIDNDPDYANNAVVKSVRSGSTNFNQVCQSVSLRGRPKEPDGRIYQTMIRSNYVFGIVNLYEFAGDSRGSAEHLLATESPLQDSEYFSRRLQLQTCVLERIAYVDCGTTRTIPWHVKPPGKDEQSGDFYPGHLRYLIGKKYIDQATGKLLTIKGNEVHLQNTTIQLRSVLTCEHPDPHAVCQVCFGLLTNNHSQYANVGVVSSTNVVSKISQKTLSTKHHISSGTGSGIVFNSDLSKYFTKGPKNTDFVLNNLVHEWNPKLVVIRDEALGLTDIANSDDIAKFNPERMSSLTEVRFICRAPGGVEFSDTLGLEQGNRVASFSSDFLAYAKVEGWSLDERNNIVFDLANWPKGKVIFTLPDMQVSFSAHGNAIAKVAESTFQNLADRSSEDAPLRVLNQLFDMVTAKLDVNIVALESIVYALQQAAVGNYSLARGAEAPIMGIGADLILNRSMGTAAAYQEWGANFLDPRTYYGENKPNTMMDVFLKPKEVVEQFKRKRASRID